MRRISSIYSALLGTWYCLKRGSRTQTDYDKLYLEFSPETEKRPEWFIPHRQEKEKYGPQKGKLLPSPPFLRLKYYDAYQIDHIVEVSDGGYSTSDNYQLLCCFCHQKKTSEYVTERARRRHAKTD